MVYYYSNKRQTYIAILESLDEQDYCYKIIIRTLARWFFHKKCKFILY